MESKSIAFRIRPNLRLVEDLLGRLCALNYSHLFFWQALSGWWAVSPASPIFLSHPIRRLVRQFAGWITAAHGGIKPEDELDYRAKAMEFIRYAQAGNVDEMLKITSSQSYASQTNSLSNLYAGQVVPQFKHTDVTWDAHCRPNKDEHNNVGLVFTGTAHGATTFSGATTYTFDVAVAKENGILFIINIW